MNMKKLLSLTLALSMTVSLAACGGGNNSSSDAGKDAAQSSGNGSYTTDELIVDIWDNNQLDGLQKIADEWSEKSGVKVRINVIN